MASVDESYAYHLPQQVVLGPPTFLPDSRTVSPLRQRDPSGGVCSIFTGSRTRAWTTGQNFPDFGSFCSRFPKKLAESVCKALPDAMFVAFNFAGTPGSHQDVPFCAKTVSREVCDAEAVIRFLRHGPLPPLAPLVIVGLSTGAIVASLLRGHSSAAVVAVAGALDVERALHLDFDAAQLHDLASGHCLKEFWLPEGSPSNPPVERCVDGVALK